MIPGSAQHSDLKTQFEYKMLFYSVFSEYGNKQLLANNIDLEGVNMSVLCCQLVNTTVTRNQLMHL